VSLLFSVVLIALTRVSSILLSRIMRASRNKPVFSSRLIGMPSLVAGTDQFTILHQAAFDLQRAVTFQVFPVDAFDDLSLLKDKKKRSDFLHRIFENGMNMAFCTFH
jgi:hypothetical protein